MGDDTGIERRHVLTLAGGVAIAALAGCLGAPSKAETPASTPTSSQPRSSASTGGSGASGGEPLVVQDTVVSGDSGLGPGQADCALTNRFYKGQLAVFRVRVIDSSTGQDMTDQDLQGVDVKIETGGGSALPMTYRMPPSDLNGTRKYWIALWNIPTSFPAGPVKYAIEVTGKTSESITFGVPAAELTILDQQISAVKQPSSES